MEITNSVVVLQPGIYILRYPKGGLAPLTISRAPGKPENCGRIEALWTPGTQGATLRDGSDCIVMHVQDAPAELLVSAFLPHAGAPAPTLRVDKIGLDEPGAAAAPMVKAPAVTAPAPKAQPAGRTIQISEEGLTLIGHIERVGDAVAPEGKYLGDPSTNLRLEGFQVMWPDHPQQVDLAYSVTLEGLGATPTVTTGQFCGSKGEARRITEVTFTLVGENARRFELKGMAHFSGGFSVPVSSGLPLSGPSGLEHLVAVTLTTAIALPQKQNVQNPWDQSSRTKVFKTKATQPQK